MVVIMLAKALPTTTSLHLRWPEPIFIRIGYVFEWRFFGKNDLTDFYYFWILIKELWNFNGKCYLFSCTPPIM